MTTQKYRILIDSQTSTNGIMVEAETWTEIGKWVYWSIGKKVVAAVPMTRVMGILEADDEGKFAQCVANNDVENLSNGVNYAHDRIEALEKDIAMIKAFAPINWKAFNKEQPEEKLSQAETEHKALFESCPIGSCNRNRKCMYVPCRFGMAVNLMQETASE